VVDRGKNKIILYEKNKQDRLVRIKEYPSSFSGSDIRIFGNKLILAGSKINENGNFFSLYSLELDSDKIEYLIPIEIKFGYKSYKEYKAKVYDEVNPIGRRAYCDAYGDYAYLTWIGDLNVVAVNLKTKEITNFSHSTKNYKKPLVTQKMLENQRTRNPKSYLEDRKFSFVTGVVADESFVAVLYVNYLNQPKGWHTYIQFYNPRGKFIEEKKLEGAVNNDNYPLKTIYYIKEKKILYFLSQTIEKDFNDTYKVLSYKIK